MRREDIVQENKSPHVATDGIWKGLHPAMGIASKGMVAAFVVFTALNVEFANTIYSAIRGWIETARASAVRDARSCAASQVSTPSGLDPADRSSRMPITSPCRVAAASAVRVTPVTSPPDATAQI